MSFPSPEQLRVEYFANNIAGMRQLANMHVAFDQELVSLRQPLAVRIQHEILHQIVAIIVYDQQVESVGELQVIDDAFRVIVVEQCHITAVD